MISRPDSKSPFGVYLHFKKDEVDGMCEDELRRSGLLPNSPSPINIELFIERHLGCALDYGDFGEGVLGVTAFDSTGKPTAVGLSAALDNGTSTGQHRLRSTAAHEAGHCILHPVLFMQALSQSLPFENVDPKARRILCRDRDFSGATTRGRWWEFQANLAIGGFLVPKKLGLIVLSPFLREAGLLGLQILPAENRSNAAAALSEAFDVSKQVSQIRISEWFPEEAPNGLL